MKSSTGWIFMVLAAGLQYVYSSPDPGPLLLTPYIEACKYDEAKNLSNVGLFQLYAQANAYSGYITVDNTTKSHLFFLFIVAEGNKSDAPLLLWTQGGPGLSALFGQFLQNGPVAFQLPMNLTRRTNTLQKTMNLLYLDLPVGAGFSFTETEGAYSTSLEDITKHVKEFLRQFFILFYEYQNRNFYLAGESYGARYSVAVADELLKEQTNLPLQLKGIIGGNGFLGPIWETADSSEFLYQASMLNKEGREKFAEAFVNIKHLHSEYPEKALYLLFSTIFTNTPRTLFQNLTLYNDHASPLYTERPLLMLMCYVFLNQTNMKMVFHAGKDNMFEYSNQQLQRYLSMDWLRDIRNLTEHVLNEIRVLFYTGQIDALFPSVKQRAYFATLQWKDAQKYNTSTRCLWKSPSQWNKSAGYLKQASNFTEAVLLGMSHYGAVEKQDEVYDLMTQFVEETLAC